MRKPFEHLVLVFCNREGITGGIMYQIQDTPDSQSCYLPVPYMLSFGCIFVNSTDHPLSFGCVYVFGTGIH